MEVGELVVLVCGEWVVRWLWFLVWGELENVVEGELGLDRVGEVNVVVVIVV